jgi:hypothetical protein
MCELSRCFNCSDKCYRTYADSYDLIKQTKHRGEYQTFLTRWEEVQNRLHIIIDLLYHIPTIGFKISFMNSQVALHIDRAQPLAECHRLLAATFSQVLIPKSEAAKSIFRHEPGQSPIMSTLQKAFEEAATFSSPTAVYLLTDGEPTDASVEAVLELIRTRPLPASTPLTLLSCTNNAQQSAWMKQVHGIISSTIPVDLIMSGL